MSNPWLDNDPCHHCQHYAQGYDRHTGITDEDCGSELGFHEDFGRTPCPCFKPILPSDGLYEQLYYEEEAQFYRELDENPKDGE